MSDKRRRVQRKVDRDKVPIIRKPSPPAPDTVTRASNIPSRLLKRLSDFVDLAQDQGTRLVNVLERCVDLYERDVKAREHMIWGSSEDPEPDASR